MPVPSVRDQAVCLRVWEWSETSQTAALFARELGVVRVLAKGARRADARFSGGLEVTARGELIAIQRPASRSGDGLATLAAWDLRELFPRVRSMLPAFHGAMYMVDLVYHAVRDADPHPDLYDALVGGLRGLGSEHDTAAALLRFQWATLVSLGVQPDLAGEQGPVGNGAAGALSFSPGLGRLVGAGPDAAGGAVWRVRAETVALLRMLAVSGSETEPLPALNDSAPGAVGRANRFLAWYTRTVLGTWPASVEATFPGITRVEP